MWWWRHKKAQTVDEVEARLLEITHRLERATEDLQAYVERIRRERAEQEGP